MSFAEAGNSLTDERCFLLQIWNGLAPAIPHAGLHSTDHLINMRRQQTLIWHPTFNSFRHQLGSGTPSLPISIASAPFHGSDRPHPTVHLVRPGLEQDGFAWGFFRPSQQ